MLVVGHNDPGYLPDVEPVEVNTLDEAIQTLINFIKDWAEPEIGEGDDGDVTMLEVHNWCRRACSLVVGSTLVVHGHAFWIK